jgi:hypothetical protein
MVNKAALAGLAVIFGIGAWLVAAPFVLRYQPAGAGRRPVPAGRHDCGAGYGGRVKSLIRDL